MILREKYAVVERGNGRGDSLMDDLKLFLTAGGFASAMGLAARLRSGESLTLGAILSSLFISFMAGIMVALFSYSFLIVKGNIYFFFGVCGLAGFGSHAILDLLFAGLMKMLSVRLNVKPRRRRQQRQKK